MSTLLDPASSRYVLECKPDLLPHYEHVLNVVAQFASTGSTKPWLLRLLLSLFWQQAWR